MDSGATAVTAAVVWRCRDPELDAVPPDGARGAADLIGETAVGYLAELGADVRRERARAGVAIVLDVEHGLTALAQALDPFTLGGERFVRHFGEQLDPDLVTLAAELA